MTTKGITPLRQRMIGDMTSRKLCAQTQRGHIYSCKRFAAFLKRSPETATCEDIRLFQLHLAEAGMSICNRNRIMTGVRFLFRVSAFRTPATGACGQVLVAGVRKPAQKPNPSGMVAHQLSPAADIDLASAVVSDVPRPNITKPYSSTSSAIESTSGRTSIPSARAVPWLMAKMNLVDCSTGSSAGLSPFRTLALCKSRLDRTSLEDRCRSS